MRLQLLDQTASPRPRPWWEDWFERGDLGLKPGLLLGVIAKVLGTPQVFKSLGASDPGSSPGHFLALPPIRSRRQRQQFLQRLLSQLSRPSLFATPRTFEGSRLHEEDK